LKIVLEKSSVLLKFVNAFVLFLPT